MAVDFVSRHTSVPVVSDGAVASARLNKRGEIVAQADWMLQLVLEGRVYNASNLTIETAAVGSTSFADTDPFLLLDVPEGTTVIPLEVYLAQAGTVAANPVQVYLTTDDRVRFSSGGTSVTPINMRKDDVRGSAALFYVGDGTAITATANTDADTLMAALLDPDVTDPNSTENFLWSARNMIPPVLIGPAALLVHLVSATTAPGVLWTVKWAEWPTSDII